MTQQEILQLLDKRKTEMYTLEISDILNLNSKTVARALLKMSQYGEVEMCEKKREGYWRKIAHWRKK